MKERRGTRSARFLLVAGGLCLSVACVRDKPPAQEGILRVSVQQQASWIRNFNPLTTASEARWPTLAGVYEPLLVFNSVQSKYVPWLAERTEWRHENRVLRVQTRSGVRWSDGESFSAHDVVFTFELMRAHPALDRRGVWGFLESVELVDSTHVDFHFQRLFVPGFDEVVAQQIVPEHRWSTIEDPVTFQNPEPVGTGPFTEVRVFRNQVYELGRNPYYWQPGKPYIDALQFPAVPSNDRANMALVFDEVDWAANFIPAIDRVFVERNPQHHQYWFPLTGSSIFLYANTQRAPFDDVRVRKALSMAIDRQLVIDVALYRYSRPADATGLSDAYSAWHAPDIAAAADWVQHDVARANQLLDEAGLSRGTDGIRRLPDGAPMKYRLMTVSGWSDWVRASQVIARGLGDIGVDVSVRVFDFSAWFQQVQEGNFDLSIGWSFEGPTPYLFYRWLMSSATIKPVGVSNMGNWHRYGSAAADAALAHFERSADPAEQKELSRQLQRIFVDEAPAIPLYPNPSWAEFNTARFTGFPNAADPYADASPNKFDRGEVLLVLTHLKPRITPALAGTAAIP